jgi:hypothetical protein
MSLTAPPRHTHVTSKFDIRTVTLAPGETLPYDEAAWDDALVRVEQGELVLQMRCGRSCYFQRGDTLWLTGLPLASLRNRGEEPTVLVAAARHPELR